MKAIISILISLCFTTMLQAQVSKTADVTAGNLRTVLKGELYAITNLKLTGTIDASDFKTLRDNMPNLVEIDLSGVTVAEYTGTNGTKEYDNTLYPANTIPEDAFKSPYYWVKSRLVKIILPSSVTAIGYEAFKSCSNLVSISFPSSLTVIEIGAFSDCSGLTSITIPLSVTSIGDFAFSGCTGLTSVNIPSSVTSIGDYAFSGCTELTSVTIPSSVTSIEKGVFSGCSGLTSVTIPSSVTSIGVSAFANCGFNSIIIPSTVTSIEDYAFSGCAGLTSVTIPSSVTTINEGVFFGCSELASVTIPLSVTSIGISAFADCGFTSFTIPSSVTSIGTSSFYYCSRLTSVIIPSSVNYIGNNAFYYCYGLSLIRVYSSYPINLSSSPNIFFGVNKNTCKLEVPYGSKVHYAEANQWKDFVNIVEISSIQLSSTEINIPASQDMSATVDVTSNVNWTVSSNQPWLTVNPGFGANNQTLTLNAEPNPLRTYRKAQITITGPDKDSQIIIVTQTASPLNVTAGNLKTFFTSEELITITKLNLTGTIDARDFKTMRDDMPLLAELDLSGVNVAAYSGTEGTASYVTEYPENEIAELAFYNLITNLGKTSLTAVTLPTSVTTIGNYAFQGCNGLITFTISASVTTIEGGAFFGFTGSFVVDPKNQYFTYSDGVLFNKTKTTLIHCTPSKMGNYVIPSTVTSIGDGAFLFCSGLTSVNVPSSTISIANWAFQQCNGLILISVNSNIPIDLTSSSGVFYGVNQTTCALNVPFGAKDNYLVANQWKDFANILEMPGLELSASEVTLNSTPGSSATINLHSSVEWTVSSDQSWISVNPTSGTGNQTITFTAEGNATLNSRTALVKVEAPDIPLHTVTVKQMGGLSKSIDITSGNLKTFFTPKELATITKLTLTGTIDARDFKTMRDEMPNLTDIDLSGAEVVAYTGTEGTWWQDNDIRTYPANEIPGYAFQNGLFSNTSLTSFIFPLSITSIGIEAFYNCSGLTSVLIPNLDKPEPNRKNA